MENKSLRNKISILILENKIEDAIIELKQWTKEPQKTDELTIQLSNYFNLSKQKRLGTQNPEEIERELTKLKASILEFTNHIYKSKNIEFGNPNPLIIGRIKKTLLKDLLLVFLGIIIGFIVGLLLEQKLTKVNTAKVNLSYPQPGNAVNRVETVSGKYENVGTHNSIWLIIYVPHVNRYFPQGNSVTLQEYGNWSSECYFGIEGDEGKIFELIVVTTNEEARSIFTAYHNRALQNNKDYEGLDKLPNGCFIHEKVSLTRK